MKSHVIAAFVLLAMAGTAAAAERSTYSFEVLLDDSRIGSHEFTVERSGDRTVVQSDAKFDVRFLFITALKYRHSTTEVWDGDCLSRISADTRVNRKRIQVRGEEGDTGFVVETDKGHSAIGECVMTFAYWEPAILEEARLLNPQSGEFLAIEVESLPPQELSIRGQQVVADAYRLTAPKVELTLWYADGRWVGLESVAKGGRILRYRLT